MKNTFKLGDIEIAVNGNPVTIKGFEFTTEATAQEVAASGGNINRLVEIIGNIAERFDNHKPEIKETEEIEVKVKEESKPVKVKPQSVNNDFCELPTSEWHGGQPVKHFNITKAWRAIPVPKSMNQTDVDQYRWEGPKGLLGDSVSVNGATFGVVYLHIYGMKQRCFITIRSGNTKFEDDIRPEDFADYMDAINIPGDIKEYIQKVIEL